MPTHENPRFWNLARTASALILLAIVGVCVILYWPKEEGVEETASSDGQRRNTRAARTPQYIDDARCADCHDEIYETYRRHPMGRSMAPTSETDGADGVLLPEDSHAFTAAGFRYDVVRRDGQLLHAETQLDENSEPLATTTLPVEYAVGSAERGRSFLVNRDGRLFMSPITWYAKKNRWDLSPGYEDRNSHFNRPVVVQCLFCHANQSHPVEDSLANYETPIFSGHAIGCQRCHGPGEDHVALHEGTAAASDAVETIVNPAWLAPNLRDAVCEQCHLSGAAKVVRRGKTFYDFRPGMPLDDVLRVFVDSDPQGDTARFVGHVEQMAASRCFQASEGQMGCISCHNPHKQPPLETRTSYFRAKCLACHQQQGCSESIDLRQVENDNCITCHMPPLGTEIRHAAITDHRILRRPSEPAAKPPPAQGTRGVSEGPSIVPFHRPQDTDAEVRRDTALALLRVEDSDDVQLDAAELQGAARDLQDAVRRHPDDLAAWEGLGMATWRMGDRAFALQCFESVLGQAPRREFALMNAATLSASLGRPDQALHYWQQALAINPWIVRYRAEAADALARLGRWADCEAACRETLEHFPHSNRSWQLLIESLLAQGQTDEADREFDSWLRLRPADPNQVRRWFRDHPLRQQ